MTAPTTTAAAEVIRLTGLVEKAEDRRVELAHRLEQIATERSTAINLGEDPPDRLDERTRIAAQLAEIDSDVAVLEELLAIATADGEAERATREYRDAHTAYRDVQGQLAGGRAALIDAATAQLAATCEAGRALRAAALEFHSLVETIETAQRRLHVAAGVTGDPAPAGVPNYISDVVSEWYRSTRTALVGVAVDQHSNVQRVLEALYVAAAEEVSR
jgi:hypothetical protein